MEWNHEKIEALVNGYALKTELWDPKDNNYHIKNRKTDAWRELANDVGCDVSEAKNKINSLMSSYRRERAKEKRSHVTGSGRSEIYVSTWFPYKLFSFLKEKDTPTNTMDTENVQNEILSNNEEELSIEPESNQPTGSTDTATQPASSVKKNAVPPKRRYKQIVEDARLDQAYKILDRAEKKNDDECSTFGQHIAMKLRKFNERSRNYLMHKINTMIFETEIEMDNYYSQHLVSSGSSPASSALRTPELDNSLYYQTLQSPNTQAQPLETDLLSTQPILQVLTTPDKTVQTFINTFK